MKKKKSGVRDLWIPESWRYNGAGVHKVKKGKGSYNRKNYKIALKKENY